MFRFSEVMWGSPNESNWGPCKETRTQMQRDDHVRAQPEESHLQTKEKGLKRNQPCVHFDLGLQPLER